MSILIYRPSLDVLSGAGQLALGQAEGLEAAGEAVELGCARGALKFRWRTGRRTRRLSCAAAAERAARGALVVDHGPAVRGAQVVFVHNCYGEALRHSSRADWARLAAQEADYFERLDADTAVVANSALVERALVERFGIAAERVSVQYPGFDTARFRAGELPELRREARRMLGLARDVPLIGFVTSGDFDKRGLTGLLDTAERMLPAREDLHCLAVGSKRLPAAAAGHAIARRGRLHHRPKGTRPELWMAALDVFVYPALFEEFGLVVLEALALGLPVLTSRRVGAAECLPAEYAPWLLERPDADALAAHALHLLDDAEARSLLAQAGARSAAALTRDAYVARTVAAILAQKRRLR